MAKKRGNNEGSITYRKDGRYMARYTVHTAEGPKRKTLYGRTRSEVAAKLTKAMSDRDGGLVFDASNLTVGEYLDRWLRDSVRDTVRASTYERHEGIVRAHIKPALGRIRLKNLTPTHVRGSTARSWRVALPRLRYARSTLRSTRHSLKLSQMALSLATLWR